MEVIQYYINGTRSTLGIISTMLVFPQFNDFLVFQFFKLHELQTSRKARNMSMRDTFNDVYFDNLDRFLETILCFIICEGYSYSLYVVLSTCSVS